MSEFPITPPGGFRTLMERMTNPTAQDMQAGQQVQELARGDVMVIVDRIVMMLKHLENRRSDVAVNVDRDQDGWTVRIHMPRGPG